MFVDLESSPITLAEYMPQRSANTETVGKVSFLDPISHTLPTGPDRVRFNDQFKHIFGTMDFRPSKLPRHTITDEQLRQSFTASSSPRKSTAPTIPLFQSPFRSKAANFKEQLRNETIMGQQKSQHTQQVSQNRAQKLQQLQIERKRQLLEQQAEYQDIEELIAHQKREEETRKLKAKYQYQINDYEGQLQKYPRVVKYLTDERYKHAVYIQNHILGNPQPTSVNYRNVLRTLRDTKLKEEKLPAEDQSTSSAKLLQKMKFEREIDQRTSMLRRLRGILNRYSQQSPIFTGKNSDSSSKEIPNTISIKQHQKYKSLEKTVQGFKRNPQKISQRFVQRLYEINHRPRAITVNS